MSEDSNEVVSALKSGVELSVGPVRALNDAELDIRLSGLEQGRVATLRASLIDDFGRAWESRACFVAADGGVIDVASQAPHGGTYQDIDAMGLIWSMAPADGRMVNGLIKSGVEPTMVNLRAEVDGVTIASSEIERLFVSPDVRRQPVRESGLVGTLFLPPGSGPFPGVLVFTGSGGGIDECRAALLASHGFAAFALAYFNAEGLPGSLIDIPLEYFETGLRWMAGRPEVDGDRLGVTGQSRGGELVLLLAATFPSIRAVVAGVPSALVWEGFGAGSHEADRPPVAWTFRGAAVPSVPRAAEEVDQSIQEGEPIPLTPYFLKAMENRAGVDQARIPIERSHAAIMLVSGEDDAMWPSARLADMVAERLNRNGYARPVVNLKYSRAGHGIRPPYSPTTVTAMEHPVDGGLYALGGTPEGNAHANVDSWRRALAFLDTHLSSETS